MLSAALLVRLSTMLLVPLLVVTGLGEVGHDVPPGTAPEAASHPRALVASASGDLRTAGTGAPSPQPSPQAAGTPGGTPDAPGAGAENAKVKKAGAQKSKAQKAAARKAKAKQQAEAKKAKKAAARKAKAKQQAEAKKAKKAAARKAKAKQQAEAKKAAAVAAAARPRSLYVGVGHGRAPNGRWQPGAQHPGGALEVDAAQIMVDAMVDVLKDAPGVELASEAGDHPNVIGSVAAANAARVDDCIEVHQDTAAAPPGAFAHWYTGSKHAQQLANGLISSVHERGVPIRRDWHRARPGLYFLRKSTCRAVLVEIGRVGDFGPDKLRELGRGMALAYLHDTANARNVPPPS